MKKNDVIKAREAYKAETIAMTNAVLTKPVLGDGIDRGRIGKTFESAVKSFLGNFIKSAISKQGKDDCTVTRSNKKRVPCEIKSGAGELASISASGTIHWGFNPNGLFIYAPVYDATQPVEKQAYVFESAYDFVTMLTDANLTRFKYSTSMNRKPKEARYHDKITIQSLSSAGRYNKIYDICEQYGTLLANWER